MTAPLQLFDALPAHIEDALRASIQRFGVLVPVVKDQHGRIVDGHHRSRIADELGVKYRVDVMQVANDEEAQDIARHLNSRRRHLSGEQLREHIVMLAQRTTPNGTGELSQREIGQIAGVAPSYVNKVLSDPQVFTSEHLPESRRGSDGKVYPARRPTVVAAKNEREAERAQEALAIVGDSAGGRVLDVKRIERIARETAAELKRAEPIEPVTVSGSVDLRHGDFREILVDLEPGSVDAIITDPPYPREFVELFADLSALGARILRPGGVLVAMVGNLYLPEYANLLATHMSYRWCCVYLLPGAHSRVHAASAASGWKPLLVFERKDSPRDARRFITDDLVDGSVGDDKTHHHWGQSESGMAAIICRFTEPGAIVVDPFLGGGTTAVACKQLGRRFIGCDIDAAAVATSRERMR